MWRILIAWGYGFTVVTVTLSLMVLLLKNGADPAQVLRWGSIGNILLGCALFASFAVFEMPAAVGRFGAIALAVGAGMSSWLGMELTILVMFFCAYVLVDKKRARGLRFWCSLLACFAALVGGVSRMLILAYSYPEDFYLFEAAPYLFLALSFGFLQVSEPGFFSRNKPVR